MYARTRHALQHCLDSFHNSLLHILHTCENDSFSLNTSNSSNRWINIFITLLCYRNLRIAMVIACIWITAHLSSLLRTVCELTTFLIIQRFGEFLSSNLLLDINGLFIALIKVFSREIGPFENSVSREATFLEVPSPKTLESHIS